MHRRVRAFPWHDRCSGIGAVAGDCSEGRRTPLSRDHNETPAVAQAQSIFDENFLSIRAKLIEVAAMLDREDRAGAAGEAARDQDAATAPEDPRRERVEQAIALLLRGANAPGERAQRLQQLFSRPYDPDWRQQFGL